MGALMLYYQQKPTRNLKGEGKSEKEGEEVREENEGERWLLKLFY